MPFDGPGAEEQLGSDLDIASTVDGEPGDVRLLRGELVDRLDRPLAHPVTGGQQLTPGPLGETLDAHRGEQAMGGPQLGAGVPAPVLAAQPFAVEEVGAGQCGAHAGPAETLDRLAIAVLSGLTSTQQGTRAGLGAQRPVGAAGAGRLHEPLPGVGCALGPAAADRRLDELGERPAEDTDVVVLDDDFGGSGCLVVPAEAVVEQRGGVVAGHSPPLAPARRPVQIGLDELGGLRFATPPG